jgi:hypothetical protein
MAIKVEVAYGKRRIACTFDTEPVKCVIAATPSFNFHRPLNHRINMNSKLI